MLSASPGLHRQPRCQPGGRAAPPPRAPPGRPRARRPEGFDLLLDVVLVPGQALSQLGDLTGDHKSEDEMPRNARITTVMTAGILGKPRRRSAAISGARAKLRSPASTSGTKTSRPNRGLRQRSPWRLAAECHSPAVLKGRWAAAPIEPATCRYPCGSLARRRA